MPLCSASSLAQLTNLSVAALPSILAQLTGPSVTAVSKLLSEASQPSSVNRPLCSISSLSGRVVGTTVSKPLCCVPA